MVKIAWTRHGKVHADDARIRNRFHVERNVAADGISILDIGSEDRSKLHIAKSETLDFTINNIVVAFRLAFRLGQVSLARFREHVHSDIRVQNEMQPLDLNVTWCIRFAMILLVIRRRLDQRPAIAPTPSDATGTTGETDTLIDAGRRVQLAMTMVVVFMVVGIRHRSDHRL